MKRGLSFIVGLGLLSGQLAHGQSTLSPNPVPPRRLSVGFDLVKTPAALIGMPLSNYPLKKETFLTIEPLVRIERRNPNQKPNRYWQGQLGFTRYTGAPAGSTYLTLTGGFLKAGPEWSLRMVGFTGAVLLTASAWQTGGEVRIPAGTFAGASLPIPQKTGGALGAELQTNRDFQFGEQWMLRLLVRYNAFLHTDFSETIAPRYLPGLGLYLSPSGNGATSPVGITAGASLQLMYTFDRHRPHSPR